MTFDQQQPAFDRRKREILEQIQSSDRSIKQSIDEHALPIVNLLNESTDYVTTSRLSSTHTSSPANEMDDAGKHKGGEWLLVSHDPVEFSAIDRCLLTCPDCCSSTAADIHSTTSTSIDDVDSKIDIDKLVLYKFEPFILHVEARDLGCAKRLVTAAMDSGFRNSGMLVSDTRIMVQIRHTMRIDAPVAVVCEEHGQPRLLVSRAYLQLLNRMTAEKFAENRRRMETLRLAIEKCLAGGDLLARSSSSNNNNNNNKETKEERRQRKREEGLKRQMSLNRNV